MQMLPGLLEDLSNFRQMKYTFHSTWWKPRRDSHFEFANSVSVPVVKFGLRESWSGQYVTVSRKVYARINVLKHLWAAFSRLQCTRRAVPGRRDSDGSWAKWPAVDGRPPDPNALSTAWTRTEGPCLRTERPCDSRYRLGWRRLKNKIQSLTLIPDSVIPEFAHTGLRDFQSRAETPYSMFCTVWYRIYQISYIPDSKS